MDDYSEEEIIELPPGFEPEEEEETEEEEEETEAEEETEDENEEEEEEEHEGNEDGGADVEEPPGPTTLRQVLHGNRGSNDVDSTANLPPQETANDDNRARSTGGDDGAVNSGELNLNGGEIDGLFCPICLEAWSSGGDHHICCLPCGHIYGQSCIKKWLRRPGSSKCPQCKKKCGMKDIRLLYASQVVAVNGELQKKVQSLEAKCLSLEKKNADILKKERDQKNKEADLCKQVRYLKERIHDLEDLLEDMERQASESKSTWNCKKESAFGFGANHGFHMGGSIGKFVMQKDLQVDGARLFDINSTSQVFVIARRIPGSGGMHVLTKMSFLYNHDQEDIPLPQNTKAVKDLHVSPQSGLVLLASLGKKLSILSMESNNTILTYDLPAAAWSCSWDVCSSHYVYAGLQNGAVLQFDTRHTTRPVEFLTALTDNPIHTIHSLSPDSSLGAGVRSVLTASSVGICQWNFGTSEKSPFIVPESDKEGVCISLAYCPTSDDIVASYRPKVGVSTDLEISQSTYTASAPIAIRQGARGSHVLYKRMGCTYQKLAATCANVSAIRLPKSAILDGLFENPVFASGDELTRELVLQELPSLMAVEHLRPQYPIRDVKHIRLSNSGLLSCLSEDSLQLFTAKLF